MGIKFQRSYLAVCSMCASDNVRDTSIALRAFVLLYPKDLKRIDGDTNPGTARTGTGLFLVEGSVGCCRLLNVEVTIAYATGVFHLIPPLHFRVTECDVGLILE